METVKPKVNRKKQNNKLFNLRRISVISLLSVYLNFSDLLHLCSTFSFVASFCDKLLLH